MICDLGAPTNFSATVEFYLPANFRIILTMLGDDANFGVEQEHFPEDDVMWWPDVIEMMCHEKRGDRCQCQMDARCHD
jgi:hypothetical protein